MNSTTERKSYSSNEMVEFVLKHGFIDKMETMVVDYGCINPVIKGKLKNLEIDSYFFDLLIENRLIQEPVSDFWMIPEVIEGQVYIKEYINFDGLGGFDGHKDILYEDVFNFFIDEILTQEIVEHLESTVEEFEYCLLNFTLFFNDETFELGSIDYNSVEIILTSDEKQRVYEFIKNLFIDKGSSYLHFLQSGIELHFSGSEYCTGERTSDIKLQESVLWRKNLDDNKTWIFNEDDLLNDDTKILIMN